MKFQLENFEATFQNSHRQLEENSVIRNFRITAADGISYYNLYAIIAVGYKVNSERAVQFLKRVTGIIEQFTVKGFAMDDERLKNDGTILGFRKCQNDTTTRASSSTPRGRRKALSAPFTAA